MSKVFFITGCSSGFGNEYVQIALEAGHKVAAAGRSGSKLSFASATKDNFLGVDLDVTSASSVHAAFEQAHKHFGRIDVLCNNAGYGLAGEFESLTEAQYRKQFDVNVFGLFECTRAALAIMREQGGGVIQQITSIGGQIGVPLYSTYCASKWAVEGFTETLSKEVKPEWGIKFTCIEPGGFRTEWAGGNMIFNKPENKCKAYDHLDAEANAKKRHGTQVGDPRRGAQAMFDLALQAEPPLRIVLGSDAFAAIEGKLKTYGENVEKGKKISLSTDVDEDKKVKA